MPTISFFYGLIIQMNYDDHNPPHIHINYQGEKSVINIVDGVIIKGKMSSRNSKLISAWVELHRDELLANWELCKNREKPYNIKPLD
jgi:hypothetical protein